MNLNNFETNFDKKILARGLDYYQNGYVSSIKEVEENVYEAEVEGTDLYIVEVEVDDQGDIIDTQCSCPYDMGDYCKHQVAVFLTLRDLVNKSSAGKEIGDKAFSAVSELTHQPAAENKGKRTDIKEILSDRSKDELVDFLSHIASEYEEIRRRIELNFGIGNDEDEIKQSIKLIRTYIQKNSDKQGFVHYRDTEEAVKGAEMVLDKAHDAFLQYKSRHSLELILCVVHEMMDLLLDSDDSNGVIGGVVEESFLIVKELTDDEDLSSVDKEYIYSKLSEEAANKRYDGWTDWRLELLEMCSGLVDNPHLRNKLKDDLAAMIKREKEDSSSTHYFEEKVSLIRYHMIERYDGQKKAQKFIEQNLHYSDFRAMAIRQAMEQKDYDLVIGLTQEGEEKDKNWPGLVQKWKECRYKAYQLAGKVDEQRSIAVEFVLKGSFEYYKKLKDTYDKKEWPSIYPKIIFLLENQKKTYRDVYTCILVEEREKQKLLDYVKEKPSEIENFYKHLVPDFQAEVNAIFLHSIEQTAARANSRKDYQEVCTIICTLKKAGGHEQASKCKQMLLAQYPKRPAFRDELIKIKI